MELSCHLVVDSKRIKVIKDLKDGTTIIASNSESDWGRIITSLNAAGLNPLKDSVLIEKDNSPYVNIVAVRSEGKGNDKIKKLVDALHSKEIQDWILKKWDGSVKPVDK